MADTINDEIKGWFAGRLSAGWYTGPATVEGDREEILVLGELADVEVEAGASDTVRDAARASRVEQHREETRRERIRIAREAEARFGRKVSWGATVGGETHTFTTAGVPVMTRLQLRERAILDTLVEAGVARSRSDALKWCVRLVARHESDWLTDLRQALEDVERVRAAGPASGARSAG